MKIEDIRKLKDEELQVELSRVRRRLFDLRSQAVTEKLEDPTLIQKARKDIARLLTTIKERDVQASKA